VLTGVQRAQSNSLSVGTRAHRKKGFAKDIQWLATSLKILAEINLKIEIAPHRLARNC